MQHSHINQTDIGQPTFTMFSPEKFQFRNLAAMMN